MLIRRVARPMLSAVFIGRGVEALRSPKPAADAARPTLDGLSKLPEPVGPNVPTDAETVAKITAAVQIGGGLLLATGKLPRLASAALALSVVPGSLGGHTFWSETDPQRKADERRAFLTDVSLIGGLIIAAVDTEGKPSLGWRGRRAAAKVTAALPVGAAAGGSLTDSELADKLGHGLHVGAERGQEIASIAGKRGAELAKIARERGAELAEVARERGAEFAEVAGKRGAELADVAGKRSAELADVAGKRSAVWADVARERGYELAEAAQKRAPELADNASRRSAELAEIARARAAELAETTRKEAKKQAKKGKKQADRRLR
ncbi:MULTISPECIES: DoxX family protein [Mycobacteriaceae]|uniref:DoxX family protein n=1 Tax=Mycobacteriaceae TaxID=1762 RepID=UPI0007FD6BD4|nr:MULTISPECIES: DoxX family protein [Mycobacteriaceae]MCK0174307.1 DoxX family protein [Mycolicibacterium sp. F2034L]OBB60475.1 DoxX family protein [Mycobacterium sp. 852013-51886_SCH5428379]